MILVADNQFAPDRQGHFATDPLPHQNREALAVNYAVTPRALKSPFPAK